MIGDRLGKWVIFKELGRGGMGRVFLAQEEIGGRQAALKVLAAELAQEVGFLQRFQQEIEALSRLDHPNIVRFYESGFENGMYFYAMEYVAGQSLEDIVHEQGRLPWQDVLDIAIQVCKALRHVHDSGIIHRDIKPPNILRSADGLVKLSDFGIAKVFASAHLTATGGIVGTAEYLSPEQAAGKPVSKRSDLYSLGIVLYVLLTGRTPFQGKTYLELLHKHRYGQFDRPQAIVLELPYEIDDVVCQLLEKDPAKRPPDCLVLGRQLERIKAKLDRKVQATLIGVQETTQAENKPDLGRGRRSEGPATLMSRLVRAELEGQNRPHLLGRLLNRGWVLILLLAACLGAIVWTFWPLSADALFERGAALMASEEPADWQRAWREYLEPLNARFPDHPYHDEVTRFQKKIEARRTERTFSDARRFYQQGERYQQEGRFREAQQVWRNLITVFQNVPADEEWVKHATKALNELDKLAADRERWQRVLPALQRAATLRDQGKRAEADTIWQAIEALYRDDPWARDVLQAVDQARKQ